MTTNKTTPWLSDKFWVPPYNYLDEVRKDFELPKRVYFHDVTLREAEQCPRVVMRPDEKLRIARELDKLGAASIEIAPFYSKDDELATRELMKMRKSGDLGARVIALSRWMESDVDLALDCGVDGIMVECVGNPWFSKAAWDVDEDGVVSRLTRVVRYAKDNGAKLVIAEPWDDYKAPLEFLERIYKSTVQEGGADHVSISDTFGACIPWATMYVVKKLRGWVPGTPVEHHAHNDFGLATTVMLSAVAAGAEVVHTSVGTLGERAGNAATEEVAMVLALLLGVETGIKLERLYSACELVATIAKRDIPPNKPIVGENEFLYSSGMVAWMVEKLRQAGRPFTMMPFAPEVIGKQGYKTILSKGAGRALVDTWARELGFHLTDAQVGTVVERVKEESAYRKGEVPVLAFREIVDEVLGK